MTAFGRVTPSDRIVDYGRDALGRVASVATRANGAATPVTVASGIAYRPFGPMTSLTYGNGLARTQTYDQDYRLTSLVAGDIDTSVQNLTYCYDAADNILSVTDAIAAGRSQSFQYDPLFRLTQATGAYGTIAYGYDAVGNRTSLVRGATSETYATDAFSNRLLSVTAGDSTRSFTYDGAGNAATDSAGNLAFAYNKANRFAQLSINGTPDTDYRYNALGQRVVKQDAGLPATAVQFHYDQDGKLLAQSDGTGALQREYVWLEGLPLATIEAGALRYVHADHLGSPQKLTDAAQAIVWDGHFEPFGEELLIAGAAAMPLRFPGQYADDETGLSYNYFRDYDPSLGRYIESDLIGLGSGLNTYAYVGGNPVGGADPMGLYCLSSGGMTFCSYPNGPTFMLPTPPGFPEIIDSNIPTYHKYDVQIPIGCADAQKVLQELIDNPTPGDPKPATRSGTLNNAEVFGLDNPVISYLVNDLITGDLLVVNVTIGKEISLFSPGYVARTVKNETAHTYGEGLNWKQAPRLTTQTAQDVGNWWVWKRQMEDIIEKCGCQK